MVERPASKPPLRWVLLAGLIGIAFFAALEVQALFAGAQNWERLLDGMGLLTALLYVVLLLAGIAALILSWFCPSRLVRLMWWSRGLGWLRWLAIAGALLVVAWCYLYSPWQGLWPGPWFQFVFALGLATCIAWLARPDAPAWRDGRVVALAFAIFLYPRVVLELRAWYKAALIYRGATGLGYLLLLALALWLFSEAAEAAARRLAENRERLGRVRWAVAAVLACGPLIYLALAGTRFYVLNPSIRFALLLLEFYGLALLIGGQAGRLLTLKAAVLSAFGLALASFAARELLLVVNYPFSLSWSEGNRIWDYSLFFGQNLYVHSGPIGNPYGEPGRYILWGTLFLWPGLPIAAHRLWGVALGVVPPLLVGWLAARKLTNPYLRIGLALFIALLFTVLSPLHPPFLLAAALTLFFVYDTSLWRRGVALAIASLYVGTSRWTWVPVTAAWGVLGDLILYYPKREGSLLKRLQPTMLLGVVGLLPGLAVSGTSGIPLSADARVYHQPLLWYRLLPNPTFPLGVLFSTILISGPLLIILIWWIASGRWELDWLQKLAVSGALVGFLGAGLVASTKIGGGADLHNLDMYLMTLVLVVALGLYRMTGAGKIDLLAWPAWTRLLIGFMLLYPLYPFTPFAAGAASSPVLELANPQEVSQVLQKIQSQADAAGQQGEVLFMDQRQLLTFGYVRNVQLVDDYEKKYVMDQAMGSNADYFQKYYEDLAHKRFAMIVTEVLRTRQESGADFSEENNAWVKWISEPTLCFYEPTMINKDVNVEILVPKQNPVGCDVYLHSGE
jgi:hypothetical protein